jgi:hypothetical protein
VNLSYTDFLHSDTLGFRTLSIVLVIKKQSKKPQRFGNWICFRPQVREKPILLKVIHHRQNPIVTTCTTGTDPVYTPPLES